jgi:hypothetical protein
MVGVHGHHIPPAIEIFFNQQDEVVGLIERTISKAKHTFFFKFFIFNQALPIASSMASTTLNAFNTSFNT